ncbi:MAG: sulfatase [Verrucomicrobiales bacterium]|nr:sulfatase [Verrucomicrobiales bacterium]
MIRKSFFALLVLSFYSAVQSAEKPNIVLFIADDVSFDDLGCYGHPHIKTPSIDRLAKNGMRFDNAYLTTSSCSPSRCSIITGRYPHNTGAPELHSPLPDSQLRFPELLREAGYYTVLSGKNHMFGNKDRSFDKITKGGGPGKEEDWVKHVENSPKDRPFFFWFASTDAHRDWQIKEPDTVYSTDQIVVPPYLVDSEKTRKDLADYYHEISRWDRYIGLVTDAIEARGELDNTMIIVIADNGRPFPRSKSRLYDSGIKTPLIVHYPATITKPAVSDSLVSVIDIAATALDIAGIEKPEQIQGTSFLPILQDPAVTTRDMVFAEHNWHVFKAHERMVRFADFLYIKNNFPELQNLCLEAIEFPAGEDLAAHHEAGKTTPAQQNIFRKPCPEDELFQVSEDPEQLNDISGEPAFADTLKQAQMLLNQWTEQTGDSVPDNPTPDRDMSAGKKNRNPHAEFPGASEGAEKINHPGPVRLP